jgi:hypothetical protein
MVEFYHKLQAVRRLTNQKSLCFQLLSTLSELDKEFMVEKHEKLTLKCKSTGVP